MITNSHTVVIGAGPVGLAAAAHLARRRMPFTVLETGDRVGASMRQWGHVRLFSPLGARHRPGRRRPPARAGLAASEPAPITPPVPSSSSATSNRSPLTRPSTRTSSSAPPSPRSLVGAAAASTAPTAPSRAFIVRYVQGRDEHEITATAVIDASGTWTSPNPLGAAGIPARGEVDAADRITYGIPDVLGTDRKRFAGKRIAVAGGGHSAANVLLDLAKLAATEPATTITWLLRRPDAARLVGGGAKDELPERGRLGTSVDHLVTEGVIGVERNFRTDRVTRTDDGLKVADADREAGPFDEIIVATGLRPDLAPLHELRVDLDDIVEAPRTLAPLIDPNVHSCGSVPPHGFVELSHPGPGFFILGMKSYGRAPTFLLRTGYEQARSVVAALAGDLDAASRVELVLPETGACSIGSSPRPDQVAAEHALTGGA